MNHSSTSLYRRTIDRIENSQALTTLVIVSGVMVIALMLTWAFTAAYNTRFNIQDHKIRYSDTVSSFAAQHEMEYLGSLPTEPAMHLMQADGIIYSFECHTVANSIICSDPISFATGEVIR